MTAPYAQWLDHAIAEAETGRDQGGIPIGSVLVDAQGQIIARGHNRRVQDNDPTAHAEVVCIRNAGRRTDWKQLTLVSTLSPCIMCTGTTLLFKIPRVVIGENDTFTGAEELMRWKGVELIHLHDPRCIQLMKTFIAEQPDLWNEDIAV
ncbi:nucleoside deaminase [Mucisphaera sp.]|uniref:nucleoside deaminase n=1 Tax=Mucisphaera sp. TaxID=2913024 RepID=UPI003D0D41AA